MPEGRKTVAENRRAWHDYIVEDHFEAGIALSGTEVKSIRQGNVGLRDAYCMVAGGELFIRGMHISPYEKGNVFNKDPLRRRKLLMHKQEIRRLGEQVAQQGYALIPMKVYFKGPHVKVDVALCKGKKLYDKRAAAAQRDTQRQLDRVIKERMS